MPFGCYKGRPLDAVPTDYLEWLASIELRATLRAAVEEELTRRRPAVDVRMFPLCPDPQLAEEMVNVGQRVLSKRAHPDAGGNHEAFLHLVEVGRWLRRLVRVDEGGR